MLPHAKRTPWIPSKYAEGERRYGRDALSNTFGECVVAKANEADCGAQTPKSKHVRKGKVLIVTNVSACEWGLPHTPMNN